MNEELKKTYEREFKNLLKRVSEISNKYEQLNKISGNAFNIFNVINVTSDEVRLHSRFLAELLNPKGSHGQEELFLQLFINQIAVDLDCKSATVKVEKYIGPKTDISGGYIDIYIKDNKGESITIENKIYAGDQENQLLRYYNFNPNNLLYLNLYGKEPFKDSYKLKKETIKGLALTSKQKTSLKLGSDFKIISYKYDIIDWLIKCKEKVEELPLLREGLNHYINLIKTLTGKSINHKMNIEIIEHISSSSDNLKQASLIAENLIQARIEIQWKFWEALKAKLENKYTLLENKKVSLNNVKSYYQDYRNKDKNYGFWIKLKELKESQLTFHFGIEVHNNIFFGFTVEEEGKGGVSNLEKFNKYKNMVSEINPSYKNHQYWLGWRHTEEILDFRAFNSEAIFNLADPEKLKNTTNIIAENIFNDINIFKSKLEKIN